MDRRVVAGIVGMVLAGSAESGRAQVGPDPSGLPPVGLTPVPSLGDTINGSSRYPGTATPSRSGAPADPRISGPAAAVPGFPVPPEPVGIRTEPPLSQAIRSGYRSGPIASILRGLRPPAGQASPATAWPDATRARPAAIRSVAPVSRPRAEPSALPEMPPIDPTAASDPPAVAAAIGRPAPFAGQAPEIARPQVDPPASTGLGRPAPLAAEPPRTARPQAPSTRPPSYRPAESPAPAPAPAPIEIPTAPELPGPSTIPPAPSAVSDSPPALTPIPGPVVPAEAPAADPEVKRVSEDVTALKLKPGAARELPFATLRAAAVGDEIITFEELNVVVTQRMEEMRGAGPMSDQEKRQVVNMIASQALDHMIDQAVILQEAKREMRNPKSQVMFNEFVDKTWRDEELPPLLRKTTTTNEYELKRKLAEQGKSYESMKEAFRKKMLARDFLNAKIHSKISSDVAEQRAYYNDHLADFEQPARFSWREIEISFARNPNRAEARAKAETALARLLRNEDFGDVARALSDGPTATKGGLYTDMTPGSYGIPVVNDELNRLPVGQMSQILEAPTAFHIVRVESRREAGPLRFDEVQDKIRPKVLEKNYQKAVENYLNKLRSKTLIRTMFDNSDSDPRLARQTDPSVQSANNR